MNSDEIICIIDRSGSMSSIASDAIGGFNAFLASQLKADSDGLMTVVLFNHEHEVVHHSKPLTEIPKLDEKNYTPGGITALYDAVGTIISSAISSFEGKDESVKPSGVTITILTDGLENASRKYSREQVAALIERAKEELEWEFVFLAANQDAMLAAQRLSINAEDASNFEATFQGTREAFLKMDDMAFERRFRQKAKRS